MSDNNKDKGDPKKVESSDAQSKSNTEEVKVEEPMPEKEKWFIYTQDSLIKRKGKFSSLRYKSINTTQFKFYTCIPWAMSKALSFWSFIVLFT